MPDWHSILNWFIPEALGLYWAVGIALLSVLTAAVTAVFGIGGGIMIMVALLMVLPPSVVLPVHSLIQMASGVSRTHAFRQYVNWPLIAWYGAGSFVGMLIASQVFVALPEKVLLFCMGGFVLWSVWSPKLTFEKFPIQGFCVVGAVLTFLSFFIGVTGPLFAAFTHKRSPEKRVFIATHAMAMNIQHSFRIFAFGLFGFAFSEWLPFVLIAAIAGFIGTVTGKALLDWLPEFLVHNAFKWVLTFLALRLLYSALTSQ